MDGPFWTEAVVKKLGGREDGLWLETLDVPANRSGGGLEHSKCVIVLWKNDTLQATSKP